MHVYIFKAGPGKWIYQKENQRTKDQWQAFLTLTCLIVIVMIPKSIHPMIMNTKKRTSGHSDSVVNLAHFCIWNSTTAVGQDLRVLRKECVTWNGRPEGLLASQWLSSWEDRIQIKEALWLFKMGSWDRRQGHVKGLGELWLFMHHLWRPHVLLGLYMAPTQFANSSQKHPMG